MAAGNYDSCRALKLEDQASGGSGIADMLPTEINPLQDALTAVGYYVQDSTLTASDKNVLLDRTSGKLRLTDTVTSHVLGELVSSTTGQVGSHNALLDAQHFMADEGPADGWASGAYQQILMTGPLVTSAIWYTSSSMATRIVGVVYAYTGPLLTTVTRTIYSASNQAIRTLTDTISYSGPIRTGVTRTWT